MTTSPVDAPSESELIVSIADRALAGKARVFAGIGLLTLAVDLARRTSNPDVELIYESGVCGAQSDSHGRGNRRLGSRVRRGVRRFDGRAVRVRALGRQRDVGVLGAAQIDRYGSLNTAVIGDWNKSPVRLPGGGAVVIMPNAGRMRTGPGSSGSDGRWAGHWAPDRRECAAGRCHQQLLSYIVMPYHPKGSLDVRIRHHGPVSLSEALRLGVKIPGALEMAHRLDILHRNVTARTSCSPNTASPRLADFGIAHGAGGFETASGARCTGFGDFKRSRPDS
jgi:hypothetical protein